MATTEGENAVSPLLGALHAVAVQQRELQSEGVNPEIQSVAWRQAQGRMTDTGL